MPKESKKETEEEKELSLDEVKAELLEATDLLRLKPAIEESDLLFMPEGMVRILHKRLLEAHGSMAEIRQIVN